MLKLIKLYSYKTNSDLPYPRYRFRSKNLLIYLRNTHFMILMFLFVSPVFQKCQYQQAESSSIIGVKIYEPQENYEQLFQEWRDMGINTAFVSVALAYDESFRSQALKDQVKVLIILPVFFNLDALKEHPEWYAITQHGTPAKEEWVEFISPSNEAYRAQRIAFIQRVVQETKPDGISLDFIRYFAYWEKIHDGRTLASLPNTSFDAASLAAFQREKEIKIPLELQTTASRAAWILANHSESWTQWKCSQIVSIVEDIVYTTKAIQPGLLVNLHAVPWRENDFEGAIKKIVGQDFKRLAKMTDFISPMCYSHMLKQDANWVSSVVKDIQRQTGEVDLLPSIQVKEAYLERELSEEEFEENLKAALKPPSKGVVFWSWAHLEQDPGKKSIISKWVKKQ